MTKTWRVGSNSAMMTAPCEFGVAVGASATWVGALSVAVAERRGGGAVWVGDVTVGGVTVGGVPQPIMASKSASAPRASRFE